MRIHHRSDSIVAHIVDAAAANSHEQDRTVGIQLSGPFKSCFCSSRRPHISRWFPVFDCASPDETT
jgi:hypothetical protein